MTVTVRTKKNGEGKVDDLDTALKAEVRTGVIEAPKIESLALTIRGDAPYVQNRFSAKAINQIRATQAAGSTAKARRKRDPKDFDALYLDSMHKSADGWYGIPASAFRNALISACRTCGFKMTLAKLSVFTLADGYDVVDGTPLVRITKGEPHKVEHFVRNDSGVVDLRARAMWDPGWEATVRIKYDAEQFRTVDVHNLLMRAGVHVGIGEGRPDSKDSAGMGWGTFEVLAEGKVTANG